MKKKKFMISMPMKDISRKKIKKYMSIAEEANNSSVMLVNLLVAASENYKTYAHMLDTAIEHIDRLERQISDQSRLENDLKAAKSAQKVKDDTFIRLNLENAALKTEIERLEYLQAQRTKENGKDEAREEIL